MFGGEPVLVRHAYSAVILLAVFSLPSCAHVQRGHHAATSPEVLTDPTDAATVRVPMAAFHQQSGDRSIASVRNSSAERAVTGEPEPGQVHTTVMEAPSQRDNTRILSSEYVVAGFVEVAPASDAEAPRRMPPLPVDDGSSAAGPFLSLPEIEQLALANNPTLAMAVAEIEKERGLWTQVGLYPNPTVGYVNSSTSGNGDSQSNGLLLQQTFITGGKLDRAQAAEAWGIRDGNFQFTAQQMRVVNDVRLRYYDVLAAQQLLAIAEEMRDVATKSLETAQRLYRAQQVAETDVLRAEVQLDSAQLALENAQTAYESAWHQLAVIAGRPELPVTSLASSEAELVQFGSLDDEWQRLLNHSPQLRSAETQTHIARAELASAQANRIPDVTLQFVSEYDSIGDFATFNSVVALPLPVINRNQGGIYSATHEVHRADREVDRVRLVLRDQLVTSLRDYEQARNRVEHYRNEILPRLKRNLDMVIAAYERQELSFLEVLNAQQTYAQSSIENVSALNEAQKLSVQIEGLQLTGGLNPADIGTAIQESPGGSRLRAVQADLQRQQAAPLKTFAPGAID